MVCVRIFMPIWGEDGMQLQHLSLSGYAPGALSLSNWCASERFMNLSLSDSWEVVRGNLIMWKGSCGTKVLYPTNI